MSSLPWTDPSVVRSISVGAAELAALTHVGQLAAESGAVTDRAARALEAIADIVPCDGAALSAWDPTTNTHRPLTSFGLPDAVVDYVGGNAILSDHGYRYVRMRRAPHRRCDVPGADGYEMISEVLLPAGFREGVTACLFTGSGRYTGVLNVVMASDEPASEDAMVLLGHIGGALAHLADVTQSLHAVGAGLGPAMAATVVFPDGRCEPLADRPPCELLEGWSPAVAEARRRAPHEPGAEAFLWHERGRLWRMLVVRLGPAEGGAVLIGAAPTESALSFRELQVLTELAAGCPNPVIAERLFISRHTVARHVEHILEKLGVAGRVEAAPRAVRAGLLLAGPAE
jgi:DNA-binding CsgD family transcriptional regulator